MKASKSLRHRLSRFAGLLLSGPFFLIGTGECQTTAPLTMISGSVVRADDLHPIAGAVVVVTAGHGGPRASDPTAARTGPDGKFSIPSVPAAEYNIECEKAGFIKQSRTLDTGGAAGQAPSTAPSAPAPIELRLVPQAVV